MSNAIDLIVQDKAIKGLDGLIVKLQTAHEEIQKINAKGIDFNKGSNTSGLKSTITLTEEYNKLVKANERANIQAELAQTEVNKSLLEARARKNEVNKQTRLQIKYEQALGGVYDKLDAKLSILNKEYRDLAVRKQLGVKLSLEEEKRMDFLTKKITKYDGVLKQVDATSGKFGRNVGNYKSGFDGLGFSIAQISREAPAFANSMQTGFMAISNNIPMAVDEIQKLRVQNKRLIAEGKETKSVLSQVGRALFSWQTLLSVGVTLLTIYGADLVKWAGNLFTASDAISIMAENTEKLNKEAQEISSKTIPQFKALVQIATDVTETEERRADAIKELNKNYPDFNTNILTEAENTEEVNKMLNDYIIKIGQKAKAQASMNMMQEKYNSLILAEQKTQAEQDKLLSKAQAIDPTIKNAEEAIKLFKERKKEADKYIVTTIYGTTTQSARQVSLNGLNKALEEQAGIQEEINGLMDIYIKNVDLTQTAENGRSTTTKATKRNQEKLLDYQRVYTKGLEIQAKAYDLMSDSAYKNSVIEAEAYIEREKRLRALREETEKYLQSVSTGTLSGFGMGSINTFFDGTFDNLLEGADTLEEKFAVTFNAISEVAKEAFSLINSFGQQNFDAEYERLAEREAIRLQFANGSATAEAEIRRQAEAQRKQIQKREAEANKKNAMFNIGISTAQGVVSALAMAPPNPILAGIIAGIGATQLAVVASQQIPQFKDGVRGFEGGMAIVGDGGVQEVIETKQGISLTPNTDTLVNLPKGANVYKNKQEFFNERLNNVLIKNGIQPITSVRQQNGFNEEKLANLIGQQIKKIPRGNAVMNFDQKGINTYWDNGITKKKMLNSRVRGLGKNT